MVSGFEVDEELLHEMRIMGATEADLEAARRSFAPADFELHEDNARAVELFQRLRTQWRTRGMDGELIGLDYAAFDPVARAMKIRAADRPRVFEDLQILEYETLNVLAERRRAQG